MYGPHISQWISSELDKDWDELREKGSLVCLDKWQCEVTEVSILIGRCFITWIGTCPNLACQSSVGDVVQTWIVLIKGIHE